MVFKDKKTWDLTDICGRGTDRYHACFFERWTTRGIGGFAIEIVT